MKTILCYGDSNTHGTCPMPELGHRQRYGSTIRWPGVLAQSMNGIADVIAEGLPGRTTVHDDPIEGHHMNGFTILPAILGSHRPIDLVIIMLGTNDLKMRFSVSAFDIALSIEKLALAVRLSGCGPGESAPDIFLVSPPPVFEVGVLAELFAGGEAKSASLSREIGRVAALYGFGFLDAGSVIQSSRIDGIHFEEQDHVALGQAVFEAVRPRLMEPT